MAKSPQSNSGSSRRTRGATIHDVAKAAGVSIGTVSKALNKTGKISPETQRKIMDVAEKLSFKPNSLAQSLHSGLSGTAGLISNDSFGRFTMPILEGLEARLHDEGMAVFMCNATDDPDLEKRHVQSLLAKRVDGLIVTARRSDYRPSVDLRDVNIPVIYVFAHSDDPETLTLLPDDEGGAAQAVRHLLELGRTNIAHITGPEHFEAVELRAKGYRGEIERDGLSDKINILHGEWSERWGREAVQELYGVGKPNPDALFCGNDQIARGANEALKERGISVPKDVSLVGFDNWTVMTNAAQPEITSVDMNLRSLGAEAGARLKEMIDGKKLKGTVRLPATLVVRQSCGSAPEQNEQTNSNSGVLKS